MLRKCKTCRVKKSGCRRPCAAPCGNRVHESRQSASGQSEADSLAAPLLAGNQGGTRACGPGCFEKTSPRLALYVLLDK